MLQHVRASLFFTLSNIPSYIHIYNKYDIQLTLEQHRFELCGSTLAWMFFSKYVRKFFGDLQEFEKLANSLQITKTVKKVRYVMNTYNIRR